MVSKPVPALSAQCVRCLVTPLVITDTLLNEAHYHRWRSESLSWRCVHSELCSRGPSSNEDEGKLQKIIIQAVVTHGSINLSSLTWILNRVQPFRKQCRTFLSLHVLLKLLVVRLYGLLMLGERNPLHYEWSSSRFWTDLLNYPKWLSRVGTWKQHHRLTPVIPPKPHST